MLIGKLILMAGKVKKKMSFSLFILKFKSMLPLKFQSKVMKIICSMAVVLLLPAVSLIISQQIQA